MRCTEVIEWMHRYLDHDLSIEESTEMFHHIDDCLPCAEIFDRLTTLSKQLEQLPDVKAPFSIVDSILPRLDELDRGLLESGKGGSEDQVVVPFSREPLQGKRQKGSSSSSIGRRTGIGAVAAALILGIAIFNMPKEMPGAQVDSIMMSDSAASTDENSATASKMNESTEETGDPAADQGAAENSPVNDNSKLETAIIESPNPSMDAKDVADSSQGGTELGTPAAENAPTDKSSDVISPKQTEQVTDAPEDASEHRKSEPAASDQTIAPDMDIMKSMKLPQGDNYDQGMMSLLPPSNVIGELSWTSPDGQYEVIVEGKQLIIYTVPPNGIGLDRLPLTSIPLEGKWVTGEWAANSLEFRYVTDNDGTIAKNVYVIPDTGTTTPLPKGTPGVTPANSASNASETPSAK
ncbi:zf-HC2 domain-containing protein [Paenibacillus wynnii]|uniref:zf-HC2 domain-containing protein n=1 Tax=Paenibacillus wynnii TaxID=268407 RepID=UPI0027938F29|nr:zf-HC2 domain-containing protein [Paenibacillus wynnii]MDQ0192679.1 anti-sigma factor RsiW [Paenibacillus wynnii]